MMATNTLTIIIFVHLYVVDTISILLNCSEQLKIVPRKTLSG